MKQERDEPIFKDPVCGMEVSYKTAAEAFEIEPGLYMSDQHQHRLRHSKIVG